ncbi:Sucrase/ferredoxin-like-domain-containing protein [Mycena amicta]|nr:Sucrase/ferredoxin-like-domain-containing protein [Mycena amicta]
MSSLRRLKAWAFNHQLDPHNIQAQLVGADVPVSEAPCRGCADPCEDGHPEYPDRFKVDMETQMLGSVRPFRRQIMISTAATDWERDVTSTRGSLASHISSAHYKSSASPQHSHSDTHVPGIFDTSASTEVAILNGSHASVCHDETVLVFPDYVAVAGVPSTSKGAQLLWKNALDPAIPRILGSKENEPGLQTWVLPYAVVITMCSHKRRDNRCAIAAPKLERAFTDSLERRGWSVDNQLEHFIDLPLEKFEGTYEEREEHVVTTLKSLQDSKRALILYNSHVGGHRYAGLTIIYTPGGASVWYGRITPHDVESIVENTIIGGLVLPGLLRGGLGLSKPGCKTLHDW